MTPIQLLDYVQKKCIEVFSINYSESNDTAIFRYRVKGKLYELVVIDISDINNVKSAQDFVQMIQANIDYHLHVQENKRK